MPPRPTALCASPGIDPDLWFEQPTFEVAREICNSCDMREDCLDVALANNEQYGVWGGLTPAERGVGRRGIARTYGEKWRVEDKQLWRAGWPNDDDLYAAIKASESYGSFAIRNGCNRATPRRWVAAYEARLAAASVS